MSLAPIWAGDPADSPYCLPREGKPSPLRLLYSLCTKRALSLCIFTSPEMNERASHSLARCPQLGISALEQEVANLFLPFCEDHHHHKKARDVSESLKPFAAFGSFRQRHGDVIARNSMRTSEAPAKLESAGCSNKGGLSPPFALNDDEGNGCLDNLMVPFDRDRLATSQTFKPPQSLCKTHHIGKSFSTDLDREEAWERKKEHYLLKEEDDECDDSEEYDADEGFYDEIGDAEEGSSGSDNGGILHEEEEEEEDSDKHIVEHGKGKADGVLPDVDHIKGDHLSSVIDDGIKKANERKPFSRRKSGTRRPVKPLIRTRTKSLTDEDMEELRGSIDLGFGFSYSEQCNLKSTLPALELYYAINKNFVDAQSRSSPVSPLDGSALVRTNSAGSAVLSPSSETWRVSSPGDHPTQVKTRLRHWAQAVACTVKQAY